MSDESALISDPSPWATEQWWAARRRQYNIGLLVAGPVGLVCYGLSLSRCIALRAPGDWEVTSFNVAVQSIAYLLVIGLANICYNLGRWCERFVPPTDIGRYRRMSFQCGFWLSVLLPLAPAAIWLTYCYLHRGEDKRIILELIGPAASWLRSFA
jgi:hypothetical protein